MESIKIIIDHIKNINNISTINNSIFTGICHIILLLFSLIFYKFEFDYNFKFDEKMEIDLKVFFLFIIRIANMGLEMIEKKKIEKKYENVILLLNNILKKNESKWNPINLAIIEYNKLSIDDKKIIMDEYIFFYENCELYGGLIITSPHPSQQLNKIAFIEEIKFAIPNIFHLSDYYGNLPLHHAVKYCDYGLIIYILENNLNAVNALNNNNELPIHILIKYNKTDIKYQIFELLIMHCGDKNHTRSNLHIALMHQDAKFILFLIDKMPFLCNKLYGGKNDTTPLHAYIENVFKAINNCCNSHHTFEDQIKIINALIMYYDLGIEQESKLCLFKQCNKNIPFVLAMSVNNEQIAKYLLKLNPKVLEVNMESILTNIETNASNLKYLHFIFDNYPSIVEIKNNNLPMYMNCFINIIIGKKFSFNMEYIFRFLLKKYYNSIYAKEDNNLYNAINNTLYDKINNSLASINGCAIYSYRNIAIQESIQIIRIMLRYNPNNNIEKFHQLNYEARKSAMFLIFSAIGKNLHKHILRRIKNHNMDILRYIMSYI